MIGFLLRRLGMVIPTFFGITILAFLLPRLVPGDPIELLVGERGISPERHAEMLTRLGLDKPMLEQYFSYIGNVLTGDLGRSIVTKEPVLREFLSLFPATIELSFCAIVIALSIGIPVGILAAVKRGSAIDYLTMGISVTGYSMPIFWWGLLLILFFSINLDLTPVSGRLSELYWVDNTTGFMLVDTLLSDEKTCLDATAIKVQHTSLNQDSQHTQTTATVIIQ